MSGLKSAWELSLEKSEKLVPELKEQKKLSKTKKDEIAEIRKEFTARIADLDVTLQHNLKRLVDRVPPEEQPARSEELTKEFIEQKDKLEKEMDERIQEVRDAS